MVVVSAWMLRVRATDVDLNVCVCQAVFQTESLAFADWLFVLAITCPVFLVDEARKCLLVRRGPAPITASAGTLLFLARLATHLPGVNWRDYSHLVQTVTNIDVLCLKSVPTALEQRLRGIQPTIQRLHV